MIGVHFSHKNSCYATPADVFGQLNAEFGFTLDVCADPENAKCDRFFTEEQDGLIQKWEGVCWMNPPYGKQIRKWMEKAYRSALEGATVVCLIPSRTDSHWWHDIAMKGEIRFIRGRLRFCGAIGDAPFPSAIVIFRNLKADKA